MDMQNVAKLKIPEGDVRTIHDKDGNLIWGKVSYGVKYKGNVIQDGTPTPDAPVAVQTVTGENVVKICGKNLFDISEVVKGRIDNGAIGYESNTTSLILGGTSFTFTVDAAWRGCASGVIPVEPNTAYHFKATASSAMGGSFVDYYNSDGWVSRYQVPGAVLDYTFTTPNNCSYIRLSWQVSQIGTFTISNPMLEKGSTATDFEPYQSQSYEVNLGDIELCKIDTYQDYIYKSGGKWYVRKEVGKITFASTTAWTKHSTTGGNVFMLNSTGFVGYGYGGNAAPALMDTARVIALGSMPDSANGVFGVNGNSQIRVFRGAYDANYTADAFKSEMVGHYIYGALATPTDTEITNEALIAQLDAVEQWLTRYGYNATVSGNLPIIIDRTAL